MTWAVGGSIMGASALLGAVTQHAQAQQQQKQKRAEMMANAAQIQTSPWTGAKAQVMGNDAADPNAAATNGALQGGLTGALMASQFGKGKPDAKPETPPGGAPPPQAPPQAPPQQAATPGVAPGTNQSFYQQHNPNDAVGSPWLQPNMYSNPQYNKNV